MYELIPADREKTGTSTATFQNVRKYKPERTQYLAASKKMARENAHSPSKNVREVSPGLTWIFPEQVLRYYHSQRRGAMGNTFFPAVTSPGFCTSYLRKINFEKPSACKKSTSEKYIFSEDKAL